MVLPCDIMRVLLLLLILLLLLFLLLLLLLLLPKPSKVYLLLYNIPSFTTYHGGPRFLRLTNVTITIKNGIRNVHSECASSFPKDIWTFYPFLTPSPAHPSVKCDPIFLLCSKFINLSLGLKQYMVRCIRCISLYTKYAGISFIHVLFIYVSYT